MWFFVARRTAETARSDATLNHSHSMPSAVQEVGWAGIVPHRSVPCDRAFVDNEAYACRRARISVETDSGSEYAAHRPVVSWVKLYDTPADHRHHHRRAIPWTCSNR